jgi:hypothetical protein
VVASLDNRTPTEGSLMRKLTLLAAAGASALTLVGASSAGAEPPANASCEGVFASLAGQFAPGTVAQLTHQLQAEAEAAGTPVGILNLEFAQSKGDCF